MMLSSVEPSLERGAPVSAGVPPAGPKTRNGRPAGGPQEKTRRRPTIVHAGGAPALTGTPPAVPHTPCRSEAKPRRETDDTMRFRATVDVQDDVARRITDAAAMLGEGGDPRGELRRLVAELEARPDADLLEGEIALVEEMLGQIDGALRADFGYRASPEWLAAVSDSLDARAPGSTATGGDVARLDEHLISVYRRLDPEPLNPPAPSTAGAAPSASRAEAPPGPTLARISHQLTAARPGEECGPALDAGEGAAAEPCSDLYKAPVPFQGRSLEGTPTGADPKELARSLDAELPVEDLLPVEPCPDEFDTKSIVISDPVIDVRDEDDALVERRAAYAENIRTKPLRRRDSVRGGVGGHTEAQASKAANDRWATLASANRIAPISFSDDPRRILTFVEHETTSRPDRGRKIADPYRGVDLPNTLERSHAAHYIPEPRGSKADCETGFGRASTGWDELPFSCRERILDALTRGESLSPDWIAALESGVEGCHAACGKLPSSQYRAMVNMISDPGGECRHARWPMHGSRGRRLLQLIEMLDRAVAVV